MEDTTERPAPGATTPAFTAGEWKQKVHGTLSGRWISIYGDNEDWDGGQYELFQSGTVEVSDDGKEWEDCDNADEIRANANLVMAAPELYKACAEFVRKVECGQAKSTRSYEQMKTALAKAHGVTT